MGPAALVTATRPLPAPTVVNHVLLPEPLVRGNTMHWPAAGANTTLVPTMLVPELSCRATVVAVPPLSRQIQMALTEMTLPLLAATSVVLVALVMWEPTRSDAAEATAGRRSRRAAARSRCIRAPNTP